MKKSFVVVFNLWFLTTVSYSSRGDTALVDNLTWAYWRYGTTTVSIEVQINRPKGSFGPAVSTTLYTFNDSRRRAPEGDLTIPSTLNGYTVVNLGERALEDCNKLTNVIIPNSVTNIGPYAFSGCSGLTSVTIPDSVKSVGNFAFSGCTGLMNVMLPDSVTRIGEKALFDCSNLESVTLPNDVTQLVVGKNAFCDNTSVAIAGKNGYGFCGWTNMVGEVIADPFHSGTENTVAPCWKKTVMVTFDPNGGYGEMVAQTMLEGDDMSLVVNSFERNGYSVIGWAKSAKGEPKTNVVAADDGTVLYAVWKPCAPNIAPANASTFQNMSQEVTISCDATDAIVLYTTDGSDPATNGMVYKGTFTVYESCMARAVVRGAGRYSDEVSVTLTRAEGLSEAANLYGYLMETDGS